MFDVTEGVSLFPDLFKLRGGASGTLESVWIVDAHTAIRWREFRSVLVFGLAVALD